MHKKIIASMTAVVMMASMVAPLTNAATYNSDDEKAFNYMNGENSAEAQLTSSKGPAEYVGTLRRDTFAALAVRWVNQVVADGSEIMETFSEDECQFTDMAKGFADLEDEMVDACRYGLMGIDSTTGEPSDKFNPTDPVTRAMMETVISRMVRGDAYNTDSGNYREDHRAALMEAKIITKDVDPKSAATRTHLGLMLMRIDLDDSEEMDAVRDSLDETLWLGDDTVLDDCDTMEPTDPLYEEMCGEEGTGTGTVTNPENPEDTCEANETYNETTKQCIPNVIPKAGNLEIGLNPNTPKPIANEVVCGNASKLKVAKFDFQAGQEDVYLQSVTLQRVGLAGDETLRGVALTLEDGTRLTKAQNENSDATVKLTIKNGYLVKAGQKVTLDVIVNVNNAYDENNLALANTDVVQFRVVEMDSSAETVQISNLISEIFTIGSQDCESVTIKEDVIVSDVKVGDKEVTVAKFIFKNEDSDHDVRLNGVSFLNEWDANLWEAITKVKMYVEGKMFAEGRIWGDYLTFQSTSGVMLEQSRNSKVEIKADIVGEINETLLHIVDSALDIDARDRQGNNIGVTFVDDGAGVVLDPSSKNKNEVLIKPGSIVIEELTGVASEVEQDNDDAILCKFDVRSLRGVGINLEDVNLVLERTLVDQSVTDEYKMTDFFEEIELYDTTRQATVFTDTNAGSTNPNTEIYEDDDLGHSLLNGSNYMEVQAKIKNLTNSESKMRAFENSLFTVRFKDMGNANGGMVFRETSDDELITDVSPSTFSCTSVKGVRSAVAFTPVTRTVDVRAVLNSKNVDAIPFELKARNISDVTVDSLTFKGEMFNVTSSADSSMVYDQLIRFTVRDPQWTSGNYQANLSRSVEYSFVYSDWSPLFINNLPFVKSVVSISNGQNIASIATSVHDYLESTNYWSARSLNVWFNLFPNSNTIRPWYTDSPSSYVIVRNTNLNDGYTLNNSILLQRNGTTNFLKPTANDSFDNNDIDFSVTDELKAKAIVNYDTSCDTQKVAYTLRTAYWFTAITVTW